jgi:pyrroloquinoline quinone biosynthesis protein B
VLLTGAEIDQVAGLLSLREGQGFTLLATPTSLGAVADNPMFRALAPNLVVRRSITPGASLQLPGGLHADMFPVPGKVPLYLERDRPESACDLANVGIELWSGAARLVYVPGAAAVTATMLEHFARAEVLLFDGTLFRDDEMIRTGTGTKTGRRMGHMAIDGSDGSLAALSSIRARKIFVHINNTNPILVKGSPERTSVESRGWEIAQDGMEIVL